MGTLSSCWKSVGSEVAKFVLGAKTHVGNISKTKRDTAMAVRPILNVNRKSQTAYKLPCDRQDQLITGKHRNGHRLAVSFRRHRAYTAHDVELHQF